KTDLISASREPACLVKGAEAGQDDQQRMLRAANVGSSGSAKWRISASTRSSSAQAWVASWPGARGLIITMKRLLLVAMHSLPRASVPTGYATAAQRKALLPEGRKA